MMGRPLNVVQEGGAGGGERGSRSLVSADGGTFESATSKRHEAVTAVGKTPQLLYMADGGTQGLVMAGV